MAEIKVPEHCTEAGARALLIRLKHFWTDRGYGGFGGFIVPDKVLGPDRRPTRFDVRSNMIDGYPPP